MLQAAFYTALGGLLLSLGAANKHPKPLSPGDWTQPPAW
jgi:hypothetical protein